MPVTNIALSSLSAPLDTPQPPEPSDERPSVGEVFGAAFRRENIVASASANEAYGVDRSKDETLNVWEEIKGSRYEPRFASFTDVVNRPQLEAKKRQIDREDEDRKTLEAAPAWLSVPASLVANVADPTILIPGGAFVRGAKGAFSVARSSLNVGAATGAAVALQEAGLMATQETRTVGEAAFDIGASVFLGGMLGAAGAALLTRSEWKSAVSGIERGLNESTALSPQPTPASVGAASLETFTLNDATISGAAGRVSSATSFVNPGQRIMNASAPEAREVGMNLFEMTQYIRGNEDGLATPLSVETLRKEWNAGLMKAAADTEDSYKAHRKAGGALRKNEFMEAVGKAMRRGDEDAIPEVAKVAQSWRKNVFDPLKEAAIEAKLLPEDVAPDTAVSYFSRLWNRRRLVAEEREFKQTVVDWVNQNSPRWMAEFDRESAEKLAKARAKQGEDAARAARDLETELRIEREARFGSQQAMNAHAREIADEVFDKLTGRAGDTGVRPEFITVKARGPLKERTFNIPDELVERWLESDVDMVGRRYQRIMSADVELARKFGSVDMKDQIQKIRDGYKKVRDGVQDEKSLLKIDEEERRIINDIESLRDLMRGTYKLNDWENNFGRIVRMANSFNYIRLMGGVLISSLPEAVRTAAVHGLKPYMEGLGAAIGNQAAFKMSVNEAKLAGNINERILSHRMATLAEINDYYTSRGPVEKFLGNLTDIASKWNGIRIWTDYTKMLASVVTQNKILDSAVNFATTDARNKRYLAYLGIDESMAGRIKKQFDEFGQIEEGVHVANTEKWTDESALRHYRAALNKDMDTIVVTKSVADIPLFANTPIGKLIFQFNTFNLASHQRILLRGLQEGPARFIGGAVSMAMIGMVGTAMRYYASNRQNELPSFDGNPGFWIAEGLDYSGIFMLPFILANSSEKLTGLNPIKKPIQAFDESAKQSTRLANRNMTSLLGPSAGVVEDLATVATIPYSYATDGETKNRQLRAAERLVPFQSYLGVRQMFRYLVNPPD